MNNNKATLSERLNKALALRGKKAVDLTRNLDIPKSAMSQYLSGKSQNMDTERLQKIARYLRVSEPWLLGYDVPMEDFGETEEQDTFLDEMPIRRLQLAFKKSGMTQVQLAKATGITKSTISRYLQGEFEPKTSALIKLASALNVSVEYLMGMETIEQEDSSEDDTEEERRSASREVFSANLRSLMGKAGKSRKEVSESIGVSYFTFSDWCNGKKYPRIEKLEALAQYFGISVSELVGEQRETIKSEGGKVLDIILRLHADTEFLGIVEKMNELDDEKLNALKQLIVAFGK